MAAFQHKEEAKLVARVAALNLMIEGYVTRKRKAERISIPKKTPIKKAKGNDPDDMGPPNHRPKGQAPLPSLEPPAGDSSLQQATSKSRSTEGSKGLPATKGTEAEATIDVRAIQDRSTLRNRRYVDYTAPPPVRQIPAVSPLKQAKQATKPFAAKVGPKGRGCADKQHYANSSHSHNKEAMIKEFVKQF